MEAKQALADAQARLQHWQDVTTVKEAREKVEEARIAQEKAYQEWLFNRKGAKQLTRAIKLLLEAEERGDIKAMCQEIMTFDNNVAQGAEPTEEEKAVRDRVMQRLSNEGYTGQQP